MGAAGSSRKLVYLYPHVLELPLSKSSLYTAITVTLLLSSLANLALIFCTTLEMFTFSSKEAYNDL